MIYSHPEGYNWEYMIHIFLPLAIIVTNQRYCLSAALHAGKRMHTFVQRFSFAFEFPALRKRITEELLLLDMRIFVSKLYVA